MRVLVGCEFSGVVRDAFIKRGHDAASCDIRESESLPNGAQRLKVLDIKGPHTLHFKMDVLSLLRSETRRWDMLIAHPPCTYLTNAGVRWLYRQSKEKGASLYGNTEQRDQERWGNMEQAALFFKALLCADIPRICVENPIMHKYALDAIDGSKYAQIIHPWQFGHAETKATCLWLKGLPPLVPTRIIKPDYAKYPAGKGNGFEPRVHHASPSPKSDPDRREREWSRTLTGIADAMAKQWGRL